MATARTSQDDTTLTLNSDWSTSSTDVAAKAYANAVDYFEKELSDDPPEGAWIRGQTSIGDVLAVVDKAKKLYDSRIEKSSKARKWVNAFASSLSQLSGVIDTLVQVDPAHAALPWGAMKFVLLAVITNEEMIYKLAKALTRISEALPRIHKDLDLYRSAVMLDAVSRLYSHILLFLQRAVNWYKTRTVRKILINVFGPWNLKFEDIVVDIKHCTETVDAYAGTSGRLEIRSLTVAMQSQSRKLHEVQARMNETQIFIHELLTQVLQKVTDNCDLTGAVKLDTGDMRPRICDIQISHILQALGSGTLPEDTLRLCEGFARRRPPWRQPGRDTVVAGQRLTEWTNHSGSSALIVRHGPQAEFRAKAMVVEVAKILKSRSIPVFWCFTSPKDGFEAPGLMKVLKSLVFQALRHNPAIVSQDSGLSSIQESLAQHGLEEWIRCAILVLSSIKQCYVVTEDLHSLVGREQEALQEAVGALDKIFQSVVAAGRVIKLMTVTCGGQAGAAFQVGVAFPIVITLNRPLPAVRRARQPPAQALRKRQRRL